MDAILYLIPLMIKTTMPRVSQQQAKQTKQRILDASLDIVLNDGVTALTFTNIADKAQVGRSNINNHFKKKNDLLTELRPQLAQIIIQSLDFRSTEHFYNSWVDAIQTKQQFCRAIDTAESFFDNESGIDGLKKLFPVDELNVENTIYMAIGYALVNLPKYLTPPDLEKL